MDAPAVPSARLVVHLREIIDDPKSNVNQSVRVKGYLKEYDPVTNRAVIEYDDAELHLNASMLDTFPYPVGKLIECIGEVRQEQEQIVLWPRITRDIDTLDMKLFERAAQYKRQYLQKTNKE
ncbi:telomere-capping, CST complex subunit-domain-containing protein [Fennellomyces sp. T-0311]|nr:telomere-capping, CST complex subunit-domain-containing protein [Fennellomyces sp. T-0311]